MKKFTQVLSTFLTLTFAMTLATVAVYAATPEVATPEAITTSDYAAELVTPGDRPDDAFTSDFRSSVIGIINYALTFLGLLAVGYIVYAGVLLVTDAGSEENTGKAKNIILFATIGIVLILMSFAVVNLIIGVKDRVA
jgi:hypothetical protein